MLWIKIYAVWEYVSYLTMVLALAWDRSYPKDPSQDALGYLGLLISIDHERNREMYSSTRRLTSPISGFVLHIRASRDDL